MPYRKSRRDDTGPRAALALAYSAYLELPEEQRRGTFAEGLCEVLLHEVRNPRCDWAYVGELCGEPAEWVDKQRALCPMHAAILRDRNAWREANRLRREARRASAA